MKPDGRTVTKPNNTLQAPIQTPAVLLNSCATEDDRLAAIWAKLPFPNKLSHLDKLLPTCLKSRAGLRDQTRPISAHNTSSRRRVEKELRV